MGDKEALTAETAFQLRCRLEVGGGLALAYKRLSQGAGAMQVDLTFLRCLDIWVVSWHLELWPKPGKSFVTL